MNWRSDSERIDGLSAKSFAYWKARDELRKLNSMGSGD
jgi:hypothetical protein